MRDRRYSTGEVAKVASVSRQMVDEHIRQRLLPHVREGRWRFVLETPLLAWLAKHPDRLAHAAMVLDALERPGATTLAKYQCPCPKCA